MNLNHTYVNSGVHFIDGDTACAEGAVVAGCRFAAGYPITPSTEVIELLARLFPKIGGILIQMEDELASSIAIVGAAWAGAKAMTVTSGPGFSLMMEHIGYATMTETPCVFVNVQRGGPSTGLPTLPGQGDMMQVRWGSHGDYEVIALCPNSPQECFDLTLQAFNLAEEYRTPVFIMMDECVGHMTERVVIPPPGKINVTLRKYTDESTEDYRAYAASDDYVPRMVKAGDGYNVHVTGLTHDERGFPDMNIGTQQALITRLISKIRNNAEKIIRLEEDGVEESEILVVSYGISSRVSARAVQLARRKGFRVGNLRLITVWPFPEARIRELAKRINAFVVVEMNQGQILREVQRCAGEQAITTGVLNAGGVVPSPEDILEKILGVTV